MNVRICCPAGSGGTINLYSLSGLVFRYEDDDVLVLNKSQCDRVDS